MMKVCIKCGKKMSEEHMVDVADSVCEVVYCNKCRKLNKRKRGIG